MLAQALQHVMQRLAAAASDAGRPEPRLLAVSKTQPATAIAELAAVWRAHEGRVGGQPNDVVAFGENYVQEALAKQAQLAASTLEWHMIGHLQSNKAREAAAAFDWVQTVDRAKLVTALARHRPPERAAAECAHPGQHRRRSAASTAAILNRSMRWPQAILAEPRLRLRGLMAIPAPHPELALRRAAFARMRGLFDALREAHPQVDTLSMGMSDDIELAVAEGATMVRVGTALFGARG